MCEYAYILISQSRQRRPILGGFDFLDLDAQTAFLLEQLGSPVAKWTRREPREISCQLGV